MSRPEIQSHAKEMVSRVDQAQIESIDRVLGGRNNQVFKVTTSSGNAYALKAYVSHPQDNRDRLGAEYAFCQHAWAQGIRCIPEPLTSDPVHLLGLYAWVEGEVPTGTHIDTSALGQVLSFLDGLEEGRDAASSAELPMASEACLTAVDHIETVQKRLDLLRQGLGDDPLDQDAAKFLSQLHSAWVEICAHVSQGLAESGFASSPLSRIQQRLSPSDLGFHNALVNKSGEFTFLDFEYAGWDDPAKLVCDFFHQEKVPVAKTYYEMFRDAVIGSRSDHEQEALRIDSLMPVYAVKWLIMRLNEFRPEGAYRRTFAEPDRDPEERKASQLEKARIAFQALQEDLGYL